MVANPKQIFSNQFALYLPISFLLLASISNPIEITGKPIMLNAFTAIVNETNPGIPEIDHSAS